MTFSLVARCAETGMFGTAVSSSSPAVAARCSYTRAGIGAVSSQNITDPSLGPLALDLMQEGKSAAEAIAAIKETAKFLEYRQVLVIGEDGIGAIHSGSNVLGTWNEASGKGVIAAGNLLANREVPHAMVEAFESTRGHLGERLLAALSAGLDAGGEAGPVHSSGMQVCDRVSWPIVDLRCDWTEDCPISTLKGIWKVYEPQMRDYVQRAVDPTRAPSYGVPGDE